MHVPTRTSHHWFILTYGQEHRHITGSAAFKVHRVQLERRYETFSDLFSIPLLNLKEQDRSYVELPDCPSDVFQFFSALYDGCTIIFFLKGDEKFLTVSYFILQITLSHLGSLLFLLFYQITSFLSFFQQHCLARLDADWPSTLCGSDFRERREMGSDEYGRYLPRK